MNEEEKKAIDLLKEYSEDELFGIAGREALQIILNLIEKQHEEKERLRIYKEQLESVVEILANGIRVLGTNPDITTEEIIKEFTEKPITEEYMEKFESGYISKDKIREYVNSPEFLDWHLGFTLLDELEYRKNNINELLEE